jgi:hypothetical protein
MTQVEEPRQGWYQMQSFRKSPLQIMKLLRIIRSETNQLTFCFVFDNESNRKEVKRESEKEKLIVSDDEGEEGEDGERKERRLKRRQTMALRREPSLVSFWQTTRFEAFKNVIRMLWYTILKHSYKLSLAGLYFICLTSVNLINAGYSKSFLRI